MQRRFLLAAASLWPLRTLAHHGWSDFDQTRPVYLEGRVKAVSWRNPHVEFELEVPADLKIPADLKSRPVPAQSASVDGPKLLATAQLPPRSAAVWEVELAPLTRMEAWKVVEFKPGVSLSVLGYTSAGEKGPAVLRAEYLFVDGKAYGLRSSPA